MSNPVTSLLYGEQEEETVVVIVVVEEEEEEVVVVVFTRENRGGSAQHATRATPICSSHGPMRAWPCAIPIYSSRRLSLFVNRSHARIRPTRIRRNTAPFKPQVR